MKNLYIISMIVMAILFACNSYAQPVLTAGNTNPVAGDSYDYFTFSAEGISEGNSGATVLWDFSGLTSTGTGTMQFVNPSETGYGASFPDANIALEQSGVFQFYDANSSSLSNLGSVATGITIPYSDPEKLFSFPMTYNTTFNDNFAGEFTNVVTFSRTGTIAVNADGYGSLITPAGTITGVLRVAITEEYEDAVGGYPMYTYTTEFFHWYKPGIHVPVMSIYRISVSGSVVSESGTYINESIGVNELFSENQNRIFPNPSNGNFFLYHNDINLITGITVTDMSGQVIYNNKPVGNDGLISIDLTGYAKGIYFLSANSENDVDVQKLVIQ